MIENKKNENANLENKRSMFFLTGLVLALGVVFMAFEWKSSKANDVMVLGETDFAPEEYVFIPSTPPEKKEPPKPIIQVPVFDIVDNDKQVDDIEMFFEEPDDPSCIDFNNLIFQNSNSPIDKEEEIVIIAEEMPEFPGGERALVNYLAVNVKYPLIAQENGIEGKVYVSFVIDENGNVYDVNILRGVDASLDNEALRVVKGMPKWSPGKQGGKPVKVRYNVPIYFELR